MQFVVNGFHHPFNFIITYYYTCVQTWWQKCRYCGGSVAYVYDDILQCFRTFLRHLDNRALAKTVSNLMQSYKWRVNRLQPVSLKIATFIFTLNSSSELFIPLSATIIWKCWFNLVLAAVTFRHFLTVSLRVQNLPFQKILFSTLVCFCLSDWSHGLRLITVLDLHPEKFLCLQLYSHIQPYVALVCF